MERIFVKSFLIVSLLFLLSNVGYSDETVTKPDEIKPEKVNVEYIGDVKYQPSAPLARGKERRPPGGIDSAEKNPIIWGWRVETPDGKGLIFGGMSINSEDPRPETQIKKDGKWVGVRDDLRKSNPLQASHDNLESLRRPFQKITALARHSYLEGLSPSSEKDYIEKAISPQVTEFISKFKEIKSSLSKVSGTNTYIANQITFANSHLDFVLTAIEGLGNSVTTEKLAILRQARIHLEIATEALDAEPPARILSMLA